MVAALLPIGGGATLLYAQKPATSLQVAGASLLAEDSCLLILNEQLDTSAILDAAGATHGSRVERATALYAALTAHASTTQADLIALLDEGDATYIQFYLVNMIEVREDPELCVELASHPDVERVEDNPIAQAQLALDLPSASFAERRISHWLTRHEFAVTESSLATPYGLEVSGALEAHNRGYLGSGVTVASQDTGVQWNHPSLKTKYRGWSGDESTVEHTYHWFDVWGTENRPRCDASNAQVPCDDNGHGTHTVGTMLGGSAADDTLIGMAPEADWIGCRNMLGGIGRPSSYTACFEFFLAPFPQDGNKLTDGRPDLGPDIINNSWGCPPEEGCDESASEILEQAVDTMRAAGQFVIASAGNSGSSCASVNQPIAMHDSSFSIGAHSSTGSIASFSSRGPVLVDGSGRPKPDISAPGVSVVSAALMTDVSQPADTRALSGTSMASPHVAGAAALLWSAVPPLVGNIDSTEQILIDSAKQSASPMLNCDDGSEAGFDYAHGHGMLDIMDAIDAGLALYPIDITLNLTTTSLLRSGVTSVVLVDPVDGTETPVQVDSGTALLPPGGLVTFKNVIARPYIVRVESATGTVGEMQIQTIPGTDANVVVTLGNSGTMFFPILMGG